jgi:hypothetical protein
MQVLNNSVITLQISRTGFKFCFHTKKTLGICLSSMVKFFSVSGIYEFLGMFNLFVSNITLVISVFDGEGNYKMLFQPIFIYPSFFIKYRIRLYFFTYFIYVKNSRRISCFPFCWIKCPFHQVFFKFFYGLGSYISMLLFIVKFSIF